jgi:hypothetical protein
LWVGKVLSCLPKYRNPILKCLLRGFGVGFRGSATFAFIPKKEISHLNKHRQDASLACFRFLLIKHNATDEQKRVFAKEHGYRLLEITVKDDIIDIIVKLQNLLNI